MAFDWWDYLEAADQWLKEARTARQGREALLRAAISRAYYAAMMSSREHLARRFGFRAPAYSTHDAIKKELELRAKGAPGLAEVLIRLSRMQPWRTRADYANEFQSRELLEAAELAIDHAMDIRSALRALK